jgi:thymidylate synthase (FAD)
MNKLNINLTDKIEVKLIQSVGGDHIIVAAAKVSTSGEDALKFALIENAEGNEGLINYLIKHHHGTPFEHSLLTFFIHAPAFVWWEWVRHRVGMTIDCPEMSFNLESGRYKKLEPVFWIPSIDRKMVPSPIHKSARPDFVQMDELSYNQLIHIMYESYETSWKCYIKSIELGVANEVARAQLGFGVYYSGWVTCNPRSLMSFLSLRTHDPNAKFVSYPQYEIEIPARITEQFLEKGWPITHAAFNKNGRTAP